MGATELAHGEVLKGLLILAGIVVSLVVIFGATFFGWGDADEDRCEQIGADVEAGRYPVSGWETDKGATETELDWWLFGVEGGAGTTRRAEEARDRPQRVQADSRPGRKVSNQRPRATPGSSLEDSGMALACAFGGPDGTKFEPCGGH